MKDSAILHFLKNFPPWIVLLAITIVFVMLYKMTGDAAYKEWTGISLASLFTALGVRASQQPPNTNIEKVENIDATASPIDEPVFHVEGKEGE